MARIVTVYNASRRPVELGDMSYIRWFRMSEALARLGHDVDIATGERPLRRWAPIRMSRNLRRVQLRSVDWDRYDVVKTEYPEGFDTLVRHGGGGHPFIISRLGSVVGPRRIDGIYFYGRRRARLYAGQKRIAEGAKLVSLVTPQATRLWQECFGTGHRTLLVPGAVDAHIPPSGPDPYPPGSDTRCLFAGQTYDRRTQPEANRVIIEKLNELGAALADRGSRLYVLGPGRTARLDPRVVSYLGRVPYLASWDYLHHADVGVLVSAGSFMHNNESTKIYHYLRAGLPMVGESGFANDHVVEESGLGTVTPSGRIEDMAEAIAHLGAATLDREAARQYILDRHTWDARARIYQELFQVEGLA